MTADFPALIVRLADNKYLLGCRISEWTNRAPALEAAVAAAAMTQDELGHARSLYAAVQATPDAPEAYLNVPADGLRSPSAVATASVDADAEPEVGGRPPLQGMPRLSRPFQHWAELVAAVALFDRAMSLVFEGARQSRYRPLRQRTAKILQEEWFHWQYGQGWLKRMAAAPTTRRAMQVAVDQFWEPTADWLGSVEDAASGKPVLTESADALRRAWLDETGALLTQCGLTRP